MRTDAADALLAQCGPRQPDSTVPAGVAWLKNVEQVARASRVASLVCTSRHLHAAHCFLKGFLSEEQAGQRIAFARAGFWRMGRHTGMVKVAAACTVWDMRVGAMAVLHTTPMPNVMAWHDMVMNIGDFSLANDHFTQFSF